MDTTEQDVTGDDKTATVNFAIMGGDVQRLDYTGGMTVRDVLGAAGQSVDTDKGTVLHVNGKPANLDDIVEPGSTVMMTAAVRNG